MMRIDRLCSWLQDDLALLMAQEGSDMQADVFEIAAREKANLFHTAAADDFTLTAVDAVDAHTILEDPNISLYCLDPPNRLALFVEVPDVDVLLAAPFFYVGQFEQAIRVFKVPYATLERLADAVTLDDRRLVLIHSMGRCGSTLMSTALGHLEETLCVSEPDVFTQLAELRDPAGSNAVEISRMVRSCLLLTCKPHRERVQPWRVVKFRSFVITLGEQLHAHFPRARTLFLYRHPEPWGRSVARAFGGDVRPTKTLLLGAWKESARVLQKVRQYPLSDPADISVGLFVGIIWLSFMERCLELQQAGLTILPVRYEDLSANPRAVTAKVLDFCAIPNVDLDEFGDLFRKDSQAATPLSRQALKQVSWELDPTDLAAIRQVIAGEPRIKTPDFILPHTLQLS